ncbi:MAG: hypothetical protein ABR987_13595 [Terracidiphilus sp.]|jgi:hypothetical protein
MRIQRLACALSALLSPVFAPAQAQPVDAAPAIIQAFDSHTIVMFGEAHENKQEYEFLCALVSTPEFRAKVDDIVVEFGNSLYQKTVDDYIAGKGVPIGEVQKAWQNTMAVGPVSPVYPAFYAAVRQANLRRGGKHKLRILLGDPYIDWDKVKSREDVGPYLAHRDEFYASVVKDEVLAKHHRALLIEGWGHFRRSAASPGFLEKQLREAGVTPYVILFGTNAVGGYNDLDKRFDSWMVPALMPLQGTWTGDLPAMPVLTGGTAPAGPNQLKLQDAADALLYLGPRDSLVAVHMPRADLDGTPYGRELARRLEILFGRAPDFLPAATETAQYPPPAPSSSPRLPMPPPPKSIHDPLPPRPLP